MSPRLIFATLSLGVVMTCTLVTAQAADYRKQSKEVTFESLTSVSSFTYTLTNYDFLPAIAVENHFAFNTKVTYLFPVNEPKPKNREVNGLINHRREQERTCIGLNL